jgi:hypothetical protein
MLRRCAVALLLFGSACSSAVSPSSGDAAAPPPPDASADVVQPPADAGIADAPPDAPDPCAPIPNAKYVTTSVTPETTSPSTHGDINLLLRKWRPASGQVAALVDINGPTDTLAPRLYTLFTDDRDPVFSGVYQLQGWDWGCNCASAYMTDPAVTMAGFAMQPAEVVELPMDGYDIGGGMQAMVLYATTETITLKYTHEDDVVKGYTIHMANICVEPALLALYEQSNAAGRTSLPALKGNQPIGRVRGSELLVTIRDTGSWMDPRSRKDWYQH